jgi:hypothetical protein
MFRKTQLELLVWGDNEIREAQSSPGFSWENTSQTMMPDSAGIKNVNSSIQWD